MDTNPSSRKAILLVFLVFGLGIALGALGTYVVTTRVHAAQTTPARTGGGGNAIALFTRDLNLSPDQLKQIEAIMSDMRERYAGIHQQADPEYEQVRQQGRDRIRQLLTPEQRPKFEDLLQKMDEERRSRQNQGR